MRPGPGTWGSAAAVLLWWWLLADLTIAMQLLITCVYFLVSWYCCERVIGRLSLQDEPQIVADEVAGMWLALIAVPASWPWMLAAFGLFRFFDIAKPGPVGWLDKRLHSGLGIMADDLLAGALAGLLLHFIWLGVSQ